jgi:hypothetical protein
VIEFSWAEVCKVIKDKKTSEMSVTDSDSDSEIAVVEVGEQSELEPGVK